MDLILHLTEKQISVIDVAQLDVEKPDAVSFAWSEQDKIENWIAQLKSSLEIVMIVDFIDETLHYDWVPKLLPWEKSAIEKRFQDKAKSDGAIFFHTRWLNDFRKNQEGREEQLIMISSVYGTEGLKSLLTMFEEAQLSITGVYSYSFIVEKYFLKNIAPAIELSRKQLKQPIMLVFRESKFSFRQIFFNNGGLRISRHIELDSELESDIALNTALVHETHVAIKYLYNQKIIPFNSEIGFIYLNSHGGDDMEIKDLFQETVALPGWDPEKAPIVVSDLYDITGTERKDQTLYGPIHFLVRFLVEKNLPSFYANEYTQKISLFKKLRQLIVVVTIALAGAATLFSFHSAVDTFLLKEKLERIEQKIASLQNQKLQLQDSIDLKYDAQDIKASVSFSESLLKVKLKGELGFNVETLSRVLENHPNILIEEISWEKQQTVDSDQLEVLLQGWVFPFEEAYEPAVNWVDALVEDLKMSDGIDQVQLTKEPLSRKSQKALMVSSSSTETVNALPFSIVLKIGSSNEN